jgi:hypothetical protein
MGEQGFGDELMFAHSIPSLCKEEPADILLLPRVALKELLGNSFKGFRVFTDLKFDVTEESLKKDFDYISTSGDIFRWHYLKYGSLPEITKLQTRTPVLFFSDKPRIGFASSVIRRKLGNALFRSVPISVFRDLTDRYDLYNFEVGKDPGVGIDLAKGFPTFQHTVDSLAGMHAVVTVDTVLAHLALGMDKPTVLVYDTYLDWRFKIGVYPKVKILSIRNPHFRMELDNFITENT